MEELDQTSEEGTIESAEPEVTETTDESSYDMEALRSKATLLGISFNARIGGKKLKEKIDLHIKDMEMADVVEEPKVGVTSKGPSNKIRQIEKAARKKVLVIITDTDSRDIDNPTIVHGVLNNYFKIGPVIIKKEEEQWVPKAIVEGLKQKTMIKMVPSINNITKRPTGNKVAEVRKRYSIAYVVAN